MLRNIFLASIFLGALGTCRASLVYTYNFNPGQIANLTDKQTSVTAPNPSTEIAQFNPDDGILQSVTLDMDFLYTFHLFTGPTGGNGASGGFSASGSLFVGGNGYSGASNGGGDGDFANQNISFQVHFTDDTAINIANLPAFDAVIGTGTAEWLWASSPTLTLATDISSGAFDSVSLTSGTLTVTYDFIAPEPATWPMILAGLGGIVTLALRRRSSRR
jgi:hypothetical protein